MLSASSPTADAEAYIAAVRQLIRDTDPASCGWVIDLRESVHLQDLIALAAVAPLLPDGPLFSMTIYNGTRLSYSVKGGELYDGDGRTVTASPPFSVGRHEPLVVLVSSGTDVGATTAAFLLTQQVDAPLMGSGTPPERPYGMLQIPVGDSMLLMPGAQIVDGRNQPMPPRLTLPNVDPRLPVRLVDDDPVLGRAVSYLEPYSCPPATTAKP
jgi:hypothetical protein